MILRTKLFAVFLVSALAAPAFGQNAPADNANTSAAFVAKANQGEWRASKLAGVAIYGTDKKSVGKIADIIVDKTGAAKLAVISVGGILGIGAKNVAVPFNTIEWNDVPIVPAPVAPAPATSDATGAKPATPMTAAAPEAAPATPSILDYPDHGTVNLTMDQLKSAPDFHYASEKLASGQ
jgi:sporulation protein YlmC with PRC-barrel domain